MLTQYKIANYLVIDRNAHYHFTVKKNHPGIFEDIALYFQDRKDPDFTWEATDKAAKLREQSQTASGSKVGTR